MKRIVYETVCDMCGRSTTDPKATSTWSGFVSPQDVCPVCIERMKRMVESKVVEEETDPAKMTNKELANALREDAEWAHANEWETPITLADDLEEAADRIANSGLEWIACKDKLPEDGKNVIFKSEGCNPQTGWRINRNWFESWSGCKVLSAPTHWMDIDAL